MRLNRLVLSLLDSPAHRLLSEGLTAISYTGPVSDRAIRLPALTVRDGDRFLGVAARPEGKHWWRAFRHPQPALLVRGGHPYDVTGQLLAGAERDSALETYLLAHPWSRRATGPATPVVAFTPRPR